MSLASSTIDVKGRSTEVLSAGQGEALVFLHGGGIVEGFDCFEPLAERFRFVAPLRPGYGATDPDPALNGRDETVEHIVDTPVRGLVYETGGRDRPGGVAAAERAASIYRMPVEVTRTDPRDHDRWIADAVAAVARVLSA